MLFWVLLALIIVWASTERQYIIDTYSWTIDDAGESCPTSTWDGSTWDSGTPDISTNVTIDGLYNTSTNGNLICRNLTINATRTLFIPDGNTVTSSGNLVCAGNIIIQENGAYVQTGSSPSNSGTGFYIVERNGADFQYQYNFWSSPLQSITINDVFGSSAQLFYSFDAATQNWQSESSATTMGVGVGYTATGVNTTTGNVTRTFANNSGFNSGDITVPSSFDITGVIEEDWNLVGNPYPSGLDVAQFLSDNSAVVDNAVYLWSSDGDDNDGSKTDYATINAAGTVNAGGSGTAPSSATISSCQGFFVLATANANLTFSNSQRVTTNNTFQRTALTTDWQRIWLSTTLDGKYQNEVLLNFTDEAQYGTDHFDAKKLSQNEHLSLYTFRPELSMLDDEQKLIIQGLPHIKDEQFIPLGLEVKTAGAFNFSINHSINFNDYEVRLIDIETGENINLLNENYNINLQVGTYDSRFVLHVMPHRVTALINDQISDDINVYSDGQKIYINFLKEANQTSALSIVDLLGKVHYQTHINHTKGIQQLSVNTLTSGIYLVKLETPQGILTRRVLLKQ